MKTKIKLVSKPPITPNGIARRKIFIGYGYRDLIYPLTLLVCMAIWIIYMQRSASWHLLDEYWPMSLTMVLGSFVAGSTPYGGGAVAYPIFTKLLHISTTDSRTFALMIQSVGMTMASILILARSIKILPAVFLIVSLSSISGLYIGTFFLYIPDPYPRVLFTTGATLFGGILIYRQWLQKSAVQNDFVFLPHHWPLFVVAGLIGGAFSSLTGSGTDMFTFIILTLIFGVDERISIPTTVLIMAITSLFGFYLHGPLLQEVGVVWHYWLAAAPVVAIGAPFGAWLVPRIQRDHLIYFILLLISLDFASTLLTVQVTPTIIGVTALIIGLCSLSLGAMLVYARHPLSRPEKESKVSKPQSAY